MTEERRKSDETKTFLGMPMRWDAKKMLANVWNRSDDRVFPPKQFGIGWDMNFHALFRKLSRTKKIQKK